MFTCLTWRAVAVLQLNAKCNSLRPSRHGIARHWNIIPRTQYNCLKSFLIIAVAVSAILLDGIIEVAGFYNDLTNMDVLNDINHPSLLMTTGETILVEKTSRTGLELVLPSSFSP